MSRAMNATLDKTESARAPARSRRRVWPGGCCERVGTHNLSLLIALACLLAIFGGLRSDVFFSARNIENIGQGMAILGILATAQTIVIVSGGLDISVGAVVGLSTVGIALGVRTDRLAALGILFGLVIGADRRPRQWADRDGRRGQRGHRHPRHDGRVPRRRLHHVGRPIDQHFPPAVPPDRLRSILGLQITIEILIAVVAIFFVLMRYTIVGRNIYAIGGNPVVARLAGLNNTATRSASTSSAASPQASAACCSRRGPDRANRSPGPMVWSCRQSRQRYSAGAR